MNLGIVISLMDHHRPMIFEEDPISWRAWDVLCTDNSSLLTTLTLEYWDAMASGTISHEMIDASELHASIELFINETLAHYEHRGYYEAVLLEPLVVSGVAFIIVEYLHKLLDTVIKFHNLYYYVPEVVHIGYDPPSRTVILGCGPVFDGRINYVE